jgi:hypothetical protein
MSDFSWIDEPPTIKLKARIAELEAENAALKTRLNTIREKALRIDRPRYLDDPDVGKEPTFCDYDQLLRAALEK